MTLRKYTTGAAIIELALVLAMLLMLSYPVFDFSRAIQATQIMISVSREGANLAARLSNSDYQRVMSDIAGTTPPFAMANNGMIYITVIKGESDSPSDPVRNVVIEQHRWLGGPSDYSPVVAIWTCSNWNWATGSCRLPSDPTTTALPLALEDGEVVYAVDVFYRLPSLFRFGVGTASAPNVPDEFHARTIL